MTKRRAKSSAESASPTAEPARAHRSASRHKHPGPWIDWRLLVGAALIAAVGIAAYSNTFHSGFVFDDIPNIVANSSIQITDLSWSSLWQASVGSLLPSRALANLTFALNYYVGGTDPLGYHIVNLIIHLLASFSVVWVAKMTLELSVEPADTISPLRDRGARSWAAVLAGLIFVAHPIQIQSVTYMVQRMNALAALFYLLALGCFIVGRRRPPGSGRWFYWSLTLVLWGAALVSKQNTATLPFAILLYESYFFRRSARSKRIWLYLLAGTALFILVGAVYLIVAEDPFQRYDTLEFSVAERVLTQGRVVALYASLVLFPWPERFNLLHDIEPSTSPFDPPSTAWAWAGLIATMFVASRIARREPLLSFSLWWILLHLVVESTLLPLELVYEHRMYLPMFGVCLAAAQLFYIIAPSDRVARGALAATLIGLLTLATYVRNDAWRDPITVWTDVVSKSPSLARAWVNRASIYNEHGQWNDAIRDFGRALDLKPHYDAALIGRGLAYANTGRQREAISDFTLALDHSMSAETGVVAQRERGTAWASLGDFQKAIADYLAAIEADPDNVASWFNLANAYRQTDQYKKAIDAYRECIRLAPNKLDAHNNLAALLAQVPDLSLRDPVQAIEHARRSCELTQFKDWNLLDTLAAAYAANREFDKAAHWQSKAAELAPARDQKALQDRVRHYQSLAQRTRAGRGP